MKQKIIKCIYVFSLIVLVFFEGFAQNIEKTLTYTDFYGLILKNHPVVKLANLEIDYAQTELLQAKGQFDPKLTSGFDRKAINGDDYYNRWATDLKIPVWGGIDLKVGNERNTGKYLRRDESDYLNFAGFSVPVGRGLLLDTRRNTLSSNPDLSKYCQSRTTKNDKQNHLFGSKRLLGMVLGIPKFLITKRGA